MQILNTNPFLHNFRGLRNLQTKIVFLNKLLWLKLKLFDFDVLYILKTTQIKTFFYIYSEFVLQDPLGTT